MRVRSSRLLLFIVTAGLLLVNGCGTGQTTSNGGTAPGGATGQGEAPQQEEAPVQTVQWDYFIFVGTTHPIGQYAEEFAAAVKERTGGALEITVRPVGELPYSATEALRVVSDGSVQLSDGLAGFIAGDSKVAALPGLPYLVRNAEEFAQIWQALLPLLQQELEPLGADVLFHYNWPPQNVWGRGEPIKTLDDFRGRKIRTTSPEQAALIQRLGAEPITLTTAEVPTAMQRGLMDAVLTAGFNALGAQWGEFLDWAYISDIHIATSYILMNRAAYDALPDPVRSDLDAVAAEFEARMLQEIPATESQDTEELANTYGVAIERASNEDIDRAVDLMRPYWEEWAQEAGPLAQEALQAVRDILGK